MAMDLASTPAALLPRVAPAPRVVGPGRKERAYQEEIARLGREAALERGRRKDLDLALQRRESELELAQLVERGSARLLDRLESDVDRTRQQEARALVLVGALQRENEHLRERLQVAEARLAALPAPRAGLLRRLVPWLR